MKIKNLLSALVILFISTASCKPQNQKETTVEITTEYGIIKLKLYNETPKHRDNFINLIKKGYFTDKVFHRIIKNFMIQGGTASATPAANTIPESDITYTIPPEFSQKLYHKKGALAGARKPDTVNPNKETTATQFYIVQGVVFTEPKLKTIEENMNTQSIQLLARKYYMEKVKDAQLKNVTYNEDEVAKDAIAKAEEEINKAPYKFTPEQQKAYTTIGGSPHLDGTYTVFGEVTEGLDVVDKLANVKTVPIDKPEKEIKFAIKIIE